MTYFSSILVCQIINSRSTALPLEVSSDQNKTYFIQINDKRNHVDRGNISDFVMITMPADLTLDVGPSADREMTKGRSRQGRAGT